MTCWTELGNSPNVPRGFHGRDADGKIGALRLLVHLWDEIEGYEDHSTTNSYSLFSRGMKAPSPGDADAQISNLTHGRAALSSYDGGLGTH